MTDNHKYRTPNPSGFFLHNAEPDDFLLPHYPPLRPIFDSIATINQNWEAWSYPGLISVIVLLIVIFIAVKNIFTRKRLEFSEKYFPKGNFKLVVWSAFVLLLFAMGIPFKLFPDLLDWFPQVKQFRATGRFAWFFFFAVSIMAVLVLDRFYMHSKGKKSAPWIFILTTIALLFHVVEGIPYHRLNAEWIARNPNLFVYDQTDPAFQEIYEAVDVSDYQALIPIPFYYIGSENFGISPAGNTVQSSMVFSFHSGLPILGSYLTRTGIQESKKIVQVISPDFYEKEIISDLVSQKPFLIVRSDSPLTEYEENILAKAKLIHQNSNMSVYSITPEQLFSNSASKRIENFSVLEPKYKAGDFIISKDSSFVYFDDFEAMESQRSFSGKAAFSGNKRDHLIVAEFGPGTFESGKTYIASTWMFNGQLDALNFWFRFRCEEYDPGKNSWNVTHTLPEQSMVINDDWSLIELEFTVQDPKNHISFKTIGKKIDKQHFYLDDLLIREKEVDVYRIDKVENDMILELFKNNHRIKRISGNL